MAKSELIARQSRWPTGVLGWFVARIMALDTARANDDAVDRLDFQPDDHVLEVGCGHGRTLRRIASKVGDGEVAGIDPSEVMRRAAEQRCARELRSGRVRIDAGTAIAAGLLLRLRFDAVDHRRALDRIDTARHDARHEGENR